MIQDLEQIEYRKGIFEKSMKPEDLPVKIWRGAKIPAKVRKAVNEENLLCFGGVYPGSVRNLPIAVPAFKIS